MDAATLYIVLTLPNGEQKATIIGKPTWAACRQHTHLRNRPIKRIHGILEGVSTMGGA
jgi:hypothetical protein